MSVKKRIPAGLVDSGFASAATFAVGVYAVRLLDAAQLGIYSLFFSAFIMASVVPTGLIFTPARVRLLAVAPNRRLRAYRQTLPLGLAVATPSALLVVVAVPSALAAGQGGLVVPMTLTAYVAACVSPLQDHLRSLLHLGDASWAAASVSVVQGVVVGVAIAVGASIGIKSAWMPFGALAVANIVSLVVGVLLCRKTGTHAPVTLRFREVRLAGGWFLTMDLFTRTAEFLARTAVVTVAAADVLGVAEGARIAARPLSVFVLGISAVVIPRSMQAARDGDRRTAKRIGRLANGGVLLIALLYVAVGGFEVALNPMARLAPIGYTVTGLVPATIAASALHGMLFAEQGEMMGGNRERALALIELVAAMAFGLTGFLAGTIGPFVIPLGSALMSIVRWIGYRIVLARHYVQWAAREVAA